MGSTIKFVSAALAVVFLVFGSAGVVVAVDCDNDVNNEVVNCGFDAGTSGWSIYTGGDSLTHAAGDGSPDLGSAVVDSDASGLAGIVSDCIDTPHIGEEVVWAGRVRLLSGTVPTECALVTGNYGGAGCTGSSGGHSETLGVPSGAWQVASYTATANSMAFAIKIFCYGGADDTVVAFDNMVFGVGATVPVELLQFGVE